MRRQDIQLRTAAKHGDTIARLQLAQKYLRGAPGLARNIHVGLAYLEGLSGVAQEDAARIISESLPLDEILQHEQLSMLTRAARVSAPAQVKLGAWRLACGEDSAGLALLRAAAASGLSSAARALETYATQCSDRLPATLACLDSAAAEELNAPKVVLAAARNAINARDLHKFCLAANALFSLESNLGDEICQLVMAAVLLSETQGQEFCGLDVEHVQVCLEHQYSQGDPRSWFVLGRALSGIPCGKLLPGQLVRGSNLRKGTAMLVRAADAGQSDAWLHLYKLNSDYRSSVANPHLGRLYLEKAAQSGHVEAQRRLGALMLRESASLRESEQAIAWLHKAAARQDEHAKALLATLVFPVHGRDEDAQHAIGEVQKSDPCLAMRLQLARDFGLTKLEALTVDPVDGQRPWGLVVGHNPFISQVRLAAPRAIPAVTDRSLGTVRQAAAFFASQHRDSASIKGDLRRRSSTQRRLFSRFHLDEDMFFVQVDSYSRDSMRVGSRWAHHARARLQLALANA